MESDILLGNIPEGWRLAKDQNVCADTLEFSIALKQQNIHEFKAILEDLGNPLSQNYGQWWDLKQIHDFVKPSDETYKIVNEWLNNFEIISKQYYGVDFLRIRLNRQEAEKLLNIKLFCFTSSQKTYSSSIYRSLKHYSIPKQLEEHIDLIGGVIRFPRLTPNHKHQQQKEKRRIARFQTTPESIQQRYNINEIPVDQTGKNIQSVVSFLGQYWSPSDLEKFQVEFGLNPRPIDKLFGPNKENEPGVEASLDVQFLTGVVNTSIPTWVYSTSGETSSGNEPFLTWLEFLNNQTTIPFVFSMSYQDYENTVGFDYANRVNTEFAKQTARGSTFFTGSGDWGVGCKDLGTGGISCNRFNADFPSTSPYVVSLGSTTLSLFGNVEEGVAYSSGGFSNYFTQPSYQSSEIDAYLKTSGLPASSFYNSTGRAFPDLATIGVNYMVTYKGESNMPVDGTSASTPCFAAQMSLINTIRLNNNKPTLGHLQPFLYLANQKSNDAYHDITTGQAQDRGCCAGQFQAVQGWDAYTGMGVPNWSVLKDLAMDETLFVSFANN